MRSNWKRPGRMCWTSAANQRGRAPRRCRPTRNWRGWRRCCVASWAQSGCRWSVDTYKADVARVALDLGATMVNDVSGLLYDPELAEVVASRSAALVLMHTRGRSREMYQAAEYRNVGREVAGELADQVAVAVGAGVERTQIIVDPGLGFAKRAEHSYAALASLADLVSLDRPILVGPSRKSFLATDGDAGPRARDWETAAAVTAAVLHGAHLVRVHEVADLVRVVRVADRIQAHRPDTSASGTETEG